MSEELLKAARIISNSNLDNFKAVSINLNDNPDQAREKILAAVKSIEKDDGVLILSAMFGGTPSNLSLSLLDKSTTEIETGENLPILVQAPYNSPNVP